MPTISAILITKNEEQRIGRCLDSLHWAYEIIVVDSGSTDRTREICEGYAKVRFEEHPWQGFGRQKNRALNLATGDWVFSIDADEVVTPELVDEIIRCVETSSCDGYWVSRKNFYRDQWVRHSGWWPDRVVRLFRKNCGRFSDRLVHECVEINGHLGVLKGCLEHHSYSCASDFLRKVDSYSSLGAQVMMQQGKSPTILIAVIKSLAAFFKTLVLKGGILDGQVGVLIAYSNATGVFYRCVKCIELRQEAGQ